VSAKGTKRDKKWVEGMRSKSDKDGIGSPSVAEGGKAEFRERGGGGEQRRTTPWAKKGGTPKGARKIGKDCHARRSGGGKVGGTGRAERQRGERKREGEEARASEGSGRDRDA